MGTVLSSGVNTPSRVSNKGGGPGSNAKSRTASICLSSGASVVQKPEAYKPALEEVTDDLMLYDLVNLTDFITITDAFGMFEIDRLQLCDDAVRKENSKNYEFEFREVELHNLEESLRAKHLAKDINTTKTGNKTLFVRSKMTVTSNPRLLLALYIFGMQTVH